MIKIRREPCKKGRVGTSRDYVRDEACRQCQAFCMFLVSSTTPDSKPLELAPSWSPTSSTSTLDSTTTQPLFLKKKQHSDDDNHNYHHSRSLSNFSTTPSPTRSQQQQYWLNNSPHHHHSTTVFQKNPSISESQDGNRAQVYYSTQKTNS